MTTHREYFTSVPSVNMALKGAQIQRYQLLTNSMSQGDIEYVQFEKYANNFNTPKSRHHNNSRIGMQGITGVNEVVRLKASYIPSGYFCAHSCNYIIPIAEDYQYLQYPLLALLNSKLYNWIYKKTSTNSNVNSYEIENLRFPDSIDSVRASQITNLVEKILTIKQKDSNDDTSLLEQQVDSIVYKLYDLTVEEITIVEGQDRSKDSI